MLLTSIYYAKVARNAKKDAAFADNNADHARTLNRPRSYATWCKLAADARARAVCNEILALFAQETEADTLQAA